jgi:hypothetical protein
MRRESLPVGRVASTDKSNEPMELLQTIYVMTQSTCSVPLSSNYHGQKESQPSRCIPLVFAIIRLHYAHLAAGKAQRKKELKKARFGSHPCTFIHPDESFAVEQDREVKSARLCTCKKGYHRYYTLSLDAIKMLTLDYQILRLQSKSLRKAVPMQENLQSSKQSSKRSTGKRQNMLKSIRNNDV